MTTQRMIDAIIAVGNARRALVALQGANAAAEVVQNALDEDKRATHEMGQAIMEYAEAKTPSPVEAERYLTVKKLGIPGSSGHIRLFTSMIEVVGGLTGATCQIKYLGGDHYVDMPLENLEDLAVDEKTGEMIHISGISARYFLEHQGIVFLKVGSVQETAAGPFLDNICASYPEGTFYSRQVKVALGEGNQFLEGYSFMNRQQYQLLMGDLLTYSSSIGFTVKVSKPGEPYEG